MSLVATWNYPTAITFGPGRIAALPEVCRSADVTRPLFVTDAGLAPSAMVADVLGLLRAAGLAPELFGAVRSNPTVTNVLDGIGRMREGGHDGVVAFGGGSALDAGKAISFLAHQSRPIWDFEDVGNNWRRADLNAIRPTIAVPTTAGTGSEVGRVCVITDEEMRAKRLVFHPRILPAAVIADPELSIDLPPALTAATGMDALCHCFEAYCAPAFHPMADGIALEGLRLIKTWLPIAHRDGRHIVARSQMMAAATMGAVAFQKGLGAVHSLAHPLGARWGAHHGLLNAILLPYVIDFNRGAIADKMDQLAVNLRLPRLGVDGVLDWIVALRNELDIPPDLQAIGIAATDLDQIVSAALSDPTAATNPVKLEPGPTRKLLLNALRGTAPWQNSGIG
jgi:alcohol dehydrogenase class IV